VLHLLHALAPSPQVEILASTYHYSLASLRSSEEFIEQVNLHRELVKRLFSLVPTTFANTDLLYSNNIARLVADLGFSCILAEGYEPALDHRSAAFPYAAHLPSISGPIDPDLASPPSPTLLLRNQHLSDALASHLADASHPLFPLTAERFAQHIASIGGPLCNIALRAEAIAAQPALLDFLASLPAQLAHVHCPFLLPRDAAVHAASAGPLDVPQPLSASPPGNLSLFLGNAMQQNAADDLYKLEPMLKSHADARLLADWRRLTTADHFAYMATLDSLPVDLSPYESPYDAYINFMNILDNLRLRAG
jgi:alpha-amylase